MATSGPNTLLSRWPVAAPLSVVAVAALYYIAARLGFGLAFAYTNISTVWPPSGVAIAALLVLGLRAWPGIWIGALLANYATGIPLLPSAAIATGNSVEAITAALLLERTGAFGSALSRSRDVLALLAAAVGSCTIAASVGVAALSLAGLISHRELGSAWITWWIGDCMGIVVIGAALITWIARAPTAPWIQRSELLSRALETVAATIALTGVAHFVFFASEDYPYAVFPVLIWIALRFGQRGAASAVLLTSCVAIWATVSRVGPFVEPTQHASLVYLQTFMGVTAVTILVLGAAVMERKRTEDALRAAEHRFRLALMGSNVVVYLQDRKLRYTWIYDGRGRLKPERILGRSDADLAPPEEAEPLTEIKQRVLRTGIGERHEVSATTQGVAATYDLFVEPIRDSSGTVCGVGGTANDITEVKRYGTEIESLNARLRQAMRETHHRVKNNLQMISAMVDMRLMDGEEQIPAEEVRRLGTHVQMLAAIHDLLTGQAKENGGADSLSSRRIIEKLEPMLRASAADRAIRVAVDDVALTIRQATSLAIVVHELCGNALKHGHGAVDVTFTQSPDGGILEVRDEGAGFPEGFDPRLQANTGLELVENLSRWDLGGGLTCTNGESGGARAVVTVRAAHDGSRGAGE